MKPLRLPRAARSGGKPVAVPRTAVALLVLLSCTPTLLRAQQQASTTDISVRVTDAATEAVLDRTRVDLMKFPDGLLQMAFTDLSGQVEFTRLLAQSYVLRASREGYLPGEVSVDIRRGESSKTVTIQLQSETPRLATAPRGLVSAKSLAAPQSAKDEFFKGAELLSQKKDPRASIAVLQHALELAPEFYEAHFLLGMAHLQLQALDEAEKYLARAVELDAKLLPPYHPLATILITRRRFEEAERLLQRALELDPKGWQWPFELARSQATQQKWAKALEYGKQARAAANVPSKIHLLLADIYSGAGQPELASGELDEFERRDPQSPYMTKVRAARAQLKKPTP